MYDENEIKFTDLMKGFPVTSTNMGVAEDSISGIIDALTGIEKMLGYIDQPLSHLNGWELGGLLGVVLDRFRQLRLDSVAERSAELAAHEHKPPMIEPAFFREMIQHAAIPTVDGQWFKAAKQLRARLAEMVQDNPVLEANLELWDQVMANRSRIGKISELVTGTVPRAAGRAADGIILKNGIDPVEP